MDIKPLADGKRNARGIMLVITRWQLLDDGTSPFDKGWTHRLCEGCETWSWHEGPAMACIGSSEWDFNKDYIDELW